MAQATEAEFGHDHWQQVVESLPDYSVVLLDAKGEVVSWGVSAERVNGYRADEVIGRHLAVFYPPEDVANGQLEQALDEARRAGRMECEGWRVRKDGSRFRVSVVITCLRDAQGSITGYAQITRDLSARSALEEHQRQLKASEDRFQIMVDSVRDYAILLLDADCKVATWGAGAERFKGYKADEIIGKHFSIFYAAEDVAAGKIERELAEIHATDRMEDEGWRVRKDGSRFWANVVITALRDEHGKITGYSKVTRDLTERKLFEERQREVQAEARFKRVVEAAPNAMVMVNQQGHITLVNRQAEALFERTRDEMLGQSLEILVPNHARERLQDQHDAYFANPETRHIGVRRDLLGVTKSGREVPIEVGLNPIETAEGLFVLASIVDIGERKKAEAAMADLNRSLALQVAETTRALTRLQETQAQLVQAEKLASLGGLVAGIAHEINTPVGVTVTAASHLQELATSVAARFAAGSLKKSELHAFIEECLEASRIILVNSRRAADLINSFKMVAVDQSSGDVRDLDLQQYFSEILLSLSPQIRKGKLDVRLQCPPDLHIKTTPGGLAQLVTNLISNTILHAYEDQQGGVLDITIVAKDASIELRFKDYGKGMSAEVLGKIFDPFFTTKRGSGGSGLGLHIVYNLVEQTLGGRITVHSVPGQGTEFIIVIPTHINHAAKFCGDVQ